jgi:hypothetical protein
MSLEFFASDIRLSARVMADPSLQFRPTTNLHNPTGRMTRRPSVQIVCAAHCRRNNLWIRWPKRWCVTRKMYCSSSTRLKTAKARLKPTLRVSQTKTNKFKEPTQMDREKLEKVKAETKFMNTQYIHEIADRVCRRAVDFINESGYKHINKTLRFNWTSEKYFTAYAYPETSDEHVIVFSDGFALELYRDAFVLSRMAKVHFCEEKYAGIFGKLEHEREGVLPPGLSDEQCKRIMFETTLEWVFFHELVHLAQGHIEIRQQNCETAVNRIIEEVMSHDNKPMEGQDALVHHATEIAADFEGLVMCLQYRYFINQGAIPYGDVYMLVCGLTCLFNRFFGPSTGEFDAIAYGSHPNPAVRWECLQPAMWNYLSHEEVKRRLPEWQIDQESLIHRLTEANVLANMYWRIRYLEAQSNEVPAFMRTAQFDRPEVKSYFQQIVTTLDKITPQIEKLYIFPIPPSLPVFSAEWRRKLEM